MIVVKSVLIKNKLFFCFYNFTENDKSQTHNTNYSKQLHNLSTVEPHS